ncbi:hypothetical protein SAMN05421505_105150 [Sinosporangium album]|uniref:Immunity protein 35 n=1 Tax=Sinosporangium album TaxID=504805 RepID=A0A1G7V7E9_9ACTN|nr:hypothetical protein [Sinosporangium album]SDG55684.1 hypothetical protein SAMN05421505_105150 [Sinosporangium album]
MNLDQARAVAEEYFNGVRPPHDPLEVSIYNFREGYVVWARTSEPEEPAALPDTAGGGCLVIDKATGEIAIRPLLDPVVVAEQWPGRHPR